MSPEQPKQSSTPNLSNFIGAFKKFMVELLDLREGTDIPETIEKIKEGIPVKSHTAWILVFSIFIASIGLNVSSTAVVIGAMLISPLMGPILGIGLSVGINDIDTLRQSFKNLGVMVGLSIVSSFLFFSIPVFQNESQELIARTKPDIRDVLIAISGGLALAVALSRRKELTNAIAGIAIATALMPPLCTAGYGLAVGNFQYFGGAIFLFTINALFIAIATFGVVKFLHFPVVRYLDSASRRRISQIISVISIIIIAGSVYQFILLFQENKYESNAKRFIKDIQTQTGIGIIDQKVDPKTKEITLVILGSRLNRQERETWRSNLDNYKLAGTKLNFTQDNESVKLMDKIEKLEDLYVSNQGFIATKEATIQDKDKEIQDLKKIIAFYQSQQIPFAQIAEEAKINNPELEELTYSKRITSNFDNTLDSIAVFEVHWSDTIPVNRKVRDERLRAWLMSRLKIDTLLIEEF